MKRLLRHLNFTAVYILIVSYSAVEFASGADITPQVQMNVQEATAYGSQRSAAENCKALAEKAQKGRSRMNAACGALSNQGMKECLPKAFKCDEVTAEESYESMGDIFSAVGLVAGIPLNQDSPVGGCPQFSGKDFFNQQKELKEKRKDLEKELNDLKKDETELAKDFKEKMKTLEQEVNDAKAEFEKMKLKIKQEERERAADALKQQIDMKANLKKLNLQMIQQRSQLTEADRQLTRDLQKFSDQMNKLQCLQAVKDARAKTMSATKSGSSGALLSQGTQNRKNIELMFSSCVDSFRQDRLAAIEKNRTAREALDRTMKDTESEIQEVQNQLDLFGQQLAEAQADAKKNEQVEQQKLYDLMQRANKDMMAEQQLFNKSQQENNNRKMQIQMQLMQLQNEMKALGPLPPGGQSDEKGLAHYANEITDGVSDINTFLKAGSCADETHEAVKSELKAWINKNTEALKKHSETDSLPAAAK